MYGIRQFNFSTCPWCDTAFNYKTDWLGQLPGQDTRYLCKCHKCEVVYVVRKVIHFHAAEMLGQQKVVETAFPEPPLDSLKTMC